MDIYIKEAIIHQFSPHDTELSLADSLLVLTPTIEEYLRKKVERVYSDEAKTGILPADHAFFSHISSSLVDTSCQIARIWHEEFSLAENQKTNDLIFLRFESQGIEHLAFLRISLRENLVHTGGADKPLTVSQNNLPSAGAVPDEAFILNLSNRNYLLIEKRIKANGAFLNYFSDQILQDTPALSPKKSIREVEKTAEKIAETFNRNDFQFQTKVKSAIFQQLEEQEALSPEQLADQLFDDNLTARLTFVDELKEVLPETVSFKHIDSSRQMKKLENQKLSLSNGIELIVPNRVYEDAESVEFIQNENGTYSILIKNIEDIRNT